MEYIKLGEISEFIMGQAPKGEDCNKIGNGTIFVKAGQFDKLYPKVEEWTTTPLKLAKKNDVLICVVGATVGKLNLGIDCAIGRSVSAIRCNSEKLDYKYLYYYLTTWISRIRGLSQGSAIGVITKDMLYDLHIPIYDITTQIKIVEILDKSQELIDKRKEQIEALDELVKSKFMEMFGDPALNPNGWDIVELSSIMTEKASNGFFAKNDEYTTHGNAKVMWLGDIINRRYSNIKGLREVNVNGSQLDKYRVKYGDLLFCRSSLNKDGIGKSSAIPKEIDNNIMFECHIIRTSLNLNRCVPEFIQIQSTMPYFRNQIMSNSKTATMTTIGQDGIIKTKVILPDLELQKKFIDIVYHIDKLKFEMEESLKELEDNFNSLMQKAFKGELFN